MILNDFLNAFRQGKSLADKATWKNRAIAASAVGSILVAIRGGAAAFGYSFDWATDSMLTAMADGVAAVLFVVAGVLHVTTSETVGLPAKDGAGDGRNETNALPTEQPTDYRG